MIGLCFNLVIFFLLKSNQTIYTTQLKHCTPPFNFHKSITILEGSDRFVDATLINFVTKTTQSIHLFYNLKNIQEFSTLVESKHIIA